MSESAIAYIKTTPDPLPTEGAVVIFFHGYGADAANIFDIGLTWNARRQQHNRTLLTFLAPEAYTKTPIGFGKQWFSLPDISLGILQEGITEAAPSIAHALTQHLIQMRLTNRPLFLAGFSQGGMVALDLACRGLIKPVKGVLVYSGVLLRTPITAPTFPILLYHGQEDTLIPSHYTEQAAETLKTKGFLVKTYLTPGLSHAIDPFGLREGLHFIEQYTPKI